MVQRMTLAAALAALVLPACGQQRLDDANLENKAEIETAIQSDTRANVDVVMKAAEYGPVIGDPLAVSTLLDSVMGQPVELSGLVGESGGVVVFARSAVWCPYCQKQMAELNNAESELAEMGMKLTVVTYDSVKELSQFAAGNGIGYQLVSDTDSSTIIANNLLNEDAKEGTRFYGIPHPAVVVLSGNGEVHNVHVDTDYRVRPSNADVIALAADVNGG